VAVYGILLALLAALVVSIARFATILPAYGSFKRTRADKMLRRPPGYTAGRGRGFRAHCASWRAMCG